jgi:hypothetical protein
MAIAPGLRDSFLPSAEGAVTGDAEAIYAYPAMRPLGSMMYSLADRVKGDVGLTAVDNPPLALIKPTKDRVHSRPSPTILEIFLSHDAASD